MTTPYALYSRNRLLGHTALEYPTQSPLVRMGAFVPTRAGEMLADVLTGPGRAFRDVARRRRALARADGTPRPARDSDFADVAAAQSHFDALELELRAPGGLPIPVRWIGIQDAEDAAHLGADAGSDEPGAPIDDPGIEVAVAHDLELIDSCVEDRHDAPEPWEADEDRGEYPRYQISVELAEPL